MSVMVTQDGHRYDHLVIQPTLVWEPPHAMAVWNVPHKLGKFPSVSCVESTGRVLYGDVEYIDSDNIRITFISAVSGKAYLN